jgi:predicted ATPase
LALAAGIRLNGRYRVEARLGGGGMGEVYRAWDASLNRDVAIKIVSAARLAEPDLRKRFAREAQAASALNHPNIVSVFDAGECDAGPFLVMELITGRTLRAILRDPPDVKLATDVGRQISRALTAAHSAGIIHRDIKPENVMVRDDGYVKVLDFGIARIANATAAHDQTTDASTGGALTGTSVVGTAAYMAPEQARGGTVGAATDIFALGLLLYELASGRHPFASAAGPLGAVARMMSETPIPPSRLNADVPPVLDALILRMLSLEPAVRPAAADVDRALSTLTGGPLSMVRSSRAPAHVVGREDVQAELARAFEGAVTGTGMVAAIGGEPGLGKTTVVEQFLEDVAASRPCLIARGRCSERHADGGAAYLPWLELLDSMRARNTTTGVGELMKTMAPTWHAQVAPMSSGDSPEARALTVNRAGSQQWLKRELATFLDEASLHAPLLLFVDDMHWADASTVDLLQYVAPRLESSRVLIVVTYRPSDLTRTRHPFESVKLDLEGRGVLREIPLQFLTSGDVEQYLTLEFPCHRFPPTLASVLHAKTEGHPLFMADAVRSLRDRGVLAEDGGVWHVARPLEELAEDIPKSVRSMIDLTLGRLEDGERRVLLAAAVQGVEFDTAIVARASNTDQADVEERLEQIARRHALVRLVREFEYPDRSLSVKYRFVHALYQDALYRSLGPTRRASTSAAVANAIATAWARQVNTRAAELGYLYETARDFSRAAEFFLIASERARQIFADRDALALARRAMTNLQALPESPERASREVMNLMAIALAMHSVRGYAARELEATYARARQLCDELGEHPLRFGVISGISAFHFMRAELRVTEQLIDQLLRLSAQTGNPVMRIWALWVHGSTYSHIGEKYEEAFARLDEGAGLYTPDLHPAFMLLTGFDAGIGCQMQAARLAWVLGRPDDAVARTSAALQQARDLRHPLMVGFGLFFHAWVLQHRDEPELVRTATDEALSLSGRYGYPQIAAWTQMLNGWARARLGQAAEGEAVIREGIAATDAMGISLLRPTFLAYLAEARMLQDDAPGALDILTQAADLAERSGEGCWLPEIRRLIAEARLQRGDARRLAEASLHEALAAALQQGAVGFAQRIEARLGRL